MAKLNKAEKFVKRQFESGKTRNQVREAIWKKLDNWDFPPEYKEALVLFDPFHDTDRSPITKMLLETALDDFVCNECGNCHELCWCDSVCTFCEEEICVCDEIVLKPIDHSAKAEKVIAASTIHAMPEPGSQAWEDMVDFMRADVDSGMGYTKLIEAVRKSIESSGLNFDEEFEKWKANNK